MAEVVEITSWEEHFGGFEPNLPGESPFDYFERVYQPEDEFKSMKALEFHYGIDSDLSKCIWLASEAFNRDFVEGNLADRIRRGRDDYGAYNWLRRRYRLRAEVARRIVDEYQLLGRLGFNFAQVQYDVTLSEHFRTELRAFKDFWSGRMA